MLRGSQGCHSINRKLNEPKLRITTAVRSLKMTPIIRLPYSSTFQLQNDKKVKGEWIKIKEQAQIVVFENDNGSLFFNFYGVNGAQDTILEIVCILCLFSKQMCILLKSNIIHINASFQIPFVRGIHLDEFFSALPEYYQQFRNNLEKRKNILKLRRKEMFSMHINLKTQATERKW